MQKIQKHLLYLEDDFSLFENYLKVLSLYFDKVTHAPDGLAGLKAYQNDKFDLILTDIQMPLMDGMEFIDNIRQIDKEIPIYVYSSMSPSFLPKHLEITQFFQKPTGMSDFLKLFSNTL